MPQEIDVRTPADRVDSTRRGELHAAAEQVSQLLPGEHTVQVVSFDNATGNAAVVVSENAAGHQGDYVSRALRHLQRIGPVLGFGPEQAVEYVADPDSEIASSGAVAVHLQQRYKGIGVYDGAETVRFDTDGALLEVAGRSHTVPADLPVAPVLSAEQALRLAAQYVASGDTTEQTDQFGEPLTEPALDLRDFAPVVRTAGGEPERLTTFDAPPFQHTVTVDLLWFPLDGGLRLAWHTRLQVPGGPVYRVLVDAAEERILLCRRLSRAITGRADVTLIGGQTGQPITLPQPLASYGAPLPSGLPAGFPDPWLTDTSTRGTCVRAESADGVPAVGTRTGDEVVFAPADPTEAKVLNLFALCGVMHDVLYLLGFREADGNFQADNRGRGGRQLDPVRALVHPGAVWGTANMGTPPDGREPLMNMGLVTRTGRHTALDPDVVYHEYTHGLTNRLVGGPMNDMSLDEVQSAGMGEGWSDFVACIIQRKTVLADWVIANPLGFRKFRYDDAYPDTFADLGTGRYVDGNVHAIGEIWCATLMSLSRRLGPWPTAQLVVDALKLTSANPSFLAARDAILLAADATAAARGDSPAARAAFVHSVWVVFARYGMGPGARTDGPTLSGIVADFSPPPRPESVSTVRAEAAPLLPIPDDDRAGVASELQLPDAGPIRELAVTVDIRHAYRGDLVVLLEPPTGQPVPLHSRAGGRARDLRRTWRAADHAGLASLRGLDTGGRWRLRVADHAPVDVGRLRSWSIEAEVGEARPTVTATAAPGLTIPDNTPAGVTSELSIADPGTISTLAVEVDITHRHTADLEVVLRSPDRRRAVLHRRGSSQDPDQLLHSYSSGDNGPLAGFVGKAVAGTWTLQVSDRAERDVGKLNRWTIRAVL